MNMKKYIVEAKELLKEIPVKIKEHPKTTIAVAGAAGLAVAGAKLLNDYYTKQISPEDLDMVVNYLHQKCFKVVEYVFYKSEVGKVESFKVFEAIQPNDSIQVEEVIDIMKGCTNREEYLDLVEKAFTNPNNFVEDNGIYKLPPENIEYIKEALESHLQKPIYKIAGIIFEISACILGALGYKVYKEESSKTK